MKMPTTLKVFYSNAKVIHRPRQHPDPKNDSVQAVTEKAGEEKQWERMTSLSIEQCIEHRSRNFSHHKPSLHGWNLSCTFFGLANWKQISRVI
jgi:hypothetical protein